MPLVKKMLEDCRTALSPKLQHVHKLAWRQELHMLAEICGTASMLATCCKSAKKYVAGRCLVLSSIPTKEQCVIQQ